MNQKIFIGIAVVLVAVAGGVWLAGQGGMRSRDAVTEGSPVVKESPAPSPSPSMREFTVVGTNFKFSLSEIKVKKGDTVKVTFKNNEGRHNWEVDEFDAETKILAAGAEETIEFVADTAGRFEYYCAVGNHRQMGMRGMLVVE
ncbi:cupredoxin domain-containing protein [Candidatus Wolfebacteria bacterium]|nr:cupredoxin domain-containing protein [Candidatus Wolfebacteria bacterium]